MVLTVIGLWVAISLLGYLIHRALHMQSLGPLYRMHMQHHRSTSRGSLIERWFGGLLFTTPAVIVAALVIAVTYMFVSPTIIALFMVMMLVYGLLHDVLHASFHRKNCSLLIKAQCLHLAHHVDPHTNFGMVFFIWDRLFGTFCPLAPKRIVHKSTLKC